MNGGHIITFFDTVENVYNACLNVASKTSTWYYKPNGS